MNNLPRVMVPNNSEAHLPAEPQQIADLAKSLADAQQKCTGVEKDAYNAFHKYKYASANSILAAGKTALAGSGLSLLPLAPQLVVIGDGANAIYGLEQAFLLTHSSGQCVPLGVVKWPVLPGKGREIDKAFAGALTSAHAYVLRGLLGIPAADPGEEISAREDRDQVEPSPPRPAAAPSPVRPAEAPTAERISETQEAELSALIRDTKTEVGKLLGHYGIRALGHLPADKFAEVQANLRKKIKPASGTSEPTIGVEAATNLQKHMEKHGASLKDWLEFLGPLPRGLADMPEPWLTWVGMQVGAKADVHELAKALQVKSFRELPADRVLTITRVILNDRIEKLATTLNITAEEWKADLTATTGAKDPADATVDQLIKLKKRLADKVAKKGASQATAPAA